MPARPLQVPVAPRRYAAGKAQVAPALAVAEVAVEQEPGGVSVVALAAFAALGTLLGVPGALLLDVPVVQALEPGDPAGRERDVAVDMAFAGLPLA